MADINEIRKLSTASSEVTIQGESGSITYAIEYGSKLPPAVLLELFDLTNKGNELQDLGTRFQALQQLPESEQMAEAVKLQSEVRRLKASFNELPNLLATIVLSQDLKDEGVPIKPDEQFFRRLPLEDQIAYVIAITTTAKRPTIASVTNSPDSSTVAAGTDTPPSNGDVSGQQNTQATTGVTSSTQTA